MKACWFDGVLIDPEHARVSVLDHGLLYGDGIFEGIRFYRGTPFRLEAHLLRLERSARALALELPYSRQELAGAARATAAATGQDEGYLRLVVTRGPGALGVDPRSCARPTAFILADRLQLVDADVRARGVRLIVASTRRLAVDELDPRIKSLNYLNQIVARLEANQAGADEALLLNRDGFIAEGTVDNLFVGVDGGLLTPPVTDGALDGITRQVVFDVARRLGLSCREQRLAVYDLVNADEAFLTGTGAELIPVGQVAGHALGTGARPLHQRIECGFRELVRAEVTAAAPQATEAAA